ncbi:glycoside hydrolase family 18 [Oscillatoria nigro-viridis PCC 7112]|uniref:chitinase n=1 Tax=Phormidium nigroviride PCC 7112 TaxID=179408 RepID=K9VCC8_9CYAN|nr:glycoside hydrolase family 18 protein [Oscillatoria nigro-viridis]AFZ05556.1 glycoside hydrolase family 18 [Oscillatoria nigro-viridis PCC 7112]
MGISTDYSNVPDWVAKPEGYPTGSMVKYNGNIFYANFWASEPGVGDADHNGWRFYDELYDQTPHTPTAQAKIIAYIPTWRKKEGFNYANDEMYRYITHGIVSFLMFSEVNLGEFEPKSLDEVKAILSDVVNTGHRNGTRISIALGGAVDYGFLKLMTDIGNNPDNPLLDRAVQNVVNFVNSNNLDGVDLDLECWWGKPGEQDQGGRPKGDGPHPAGSALTLFAQKLKQAMPDKLVSAAIFGTSWYGNNYDPKLADYVDWLGIMTYDLTGSWNSSPVGPHTTLYKIRNQESYVEEQQGEWPGGGIVNNPILSVEDTLWYWTNPLFVNWQGAGQNIPRNKIAAGVPIYGYDFAYGKDPDDLSGQVPPGYKSIRYKDILAQFPDAHTAANGNIKVSGSTPRPPFISASGNYPYTHNIYFETPDTAVSKLNFLKDVGAQGVIIWELSNDVWEDNKSIIKALYQNSGNPEKPPLPSTLEPSITPLGIFDNAKALTTGSANIIGTSGPPAVAVYDDKLFCVHEGQGEDGYLWYCTFDFKRNEWSQDIKLSFGTGGPPAVAVYDNKLFCVHEGQGEDGYLWYCTFDFKRNEWSQDIRLNVGVGSRRHNNPSAALAVYREKLFCVHEGRGEDGLLWGCTFDKNTQTWSEDSWLVSGGKWPWDPKPGTVGSAPPFIKSSGAPGLAVLNDRLICLHEGSSESGTLWHCDFNGTEWSKDQEFFPTAELAAPVISITGPPSLEVIDGKLFCFYEGPGADGYLHTLNYDLKHEDLNTDIGLSGSPAAKAYNGELYILHEGPGDDGRLMMTNAPLPKVPKGWIEVRGENSYCYCVCNRASSEQQGDISHSHTMNIEAGAPYFYAVLTKDDDTVDFPTGAILTIQDPDGTKYDRDIQEENLLVIMSGSSVRCLIVKNPKPGNWTMTMTVPDGVGFHCECNTIPSKDVYDTITTALSTTNQLQKRSVVALGMLGLAVLVNFYLEDNKTKNQDIKLVPELVGTAVESPTSIALNASGATPTRSNSEKATALAAAASLSSKEKALVTEGDALQQYLLEGKGNNDTGTFEILDSNGTGTPETYTSYLRWIAAIRPRLGGNGYFAVRLQLPDSQQSPWIRIQASGFYLEAFSTADNPFVNGNWQGRDIPENLIPYPDPSSPENAPTVSFDSINQGAIPNANNWMNGTTDTLNHSTVVILIFVISEAARFDGVAFAVDRVLSQFATYNWYYFRPLLNLWDPISNQYYNTERHAGVSVRAAGQMVRRRPELQNDLPRRNTLLNYLVALVRDYGYPSEPNN